MRNERIENLSDQQALDILRSLGAEFATEETPETGEDQVQALQELFRKEGQDVELGIAPVASPGETARQLLSLMAETPEMGPAIEEWLENPPAQETAGLPLILAMPVVMTGCIVLLQIAAQTRLRRDKTGKWDFEYDPSRKTPLGKTMKDLIEIMAGMVGRLPS